MKKDNLKTVTWLAFALLIVSAPVSSTLYGSAGNVVGAVHEIREREQKAMDGFRTLLKAPVKTLPTWEQFVDTYAPLLEGTQYDDLGKTLKNLRNELKTAFSKLWGQKNIAEALNKYLPTLPADIANAIRNMSISELRERVKA